MSSSDSEEFFDAEAGDHTSPKQARPVAPACNRSMTRSGDTTVTDGQLEEHSGYAIFRERRRSVSRARSADGASLKRPLHRYSLQQPTIPPIPLIPARFMKTGQPASIASASQLQPDAAQTRATGATPSPPLGRSERPSTSAGVGTSAAAKPGNESHSIKRNDSLSAGRNATNVARRAKPGLQLVTFPPDFRRSRSMPSTPKKVDLSTLSKLESRAQPENNNNPNIPRMSRSGRNRNSDLFLELAHDQMEGEDGIGQLQRSTSRASYAGKRRSLPADVLVNSSDKRPSTSGNIYTRPTSRLHTARGSTELQRHMDQYRSPANRASFQFDDSASSSGRANSGRARRFSVLPDRSPLSPSQVGERVRSPELTQFQHMQPSFGALSAGARQRNQIHQDRTHDSYDESLAEGSEPKQSDTSAESQTDTVWDELDDLKSRIKKLELTGKMPPTSSAAVSGDSGDRPRTATTAPTTINSSPKHEPKQESESKKATPTPPPESAVGANATANMHLLLHAALAKAKALLHGTVYRTLEATATDALQLATMTGGAGPQGTNFSAASIINGVTVSDRHVRRKADSMCRNLTDLCLALCEGKHEAPSIVSSPTSMNIAVQDSPSLRYPRSSFGSNASSTARPMSRLEARRSSILGVPPAHVTSGVSPRGSVGDISASEQESTVSYSQQPRRISRAPSNMLRSRPQPQDDISGDDEPTIRPPSRAMTGINTIRAKSRITSEDRSPAQLSQQRTPSLRESLTARNSNEAAFGNNRETSGITSIGTEPRRRRLYDNYATPPVQEEDIRPADHQSSSQPRRRITSLGQYSTGSRRTTTELPSRAPSLNQRRHMIVE